MLRIPFLSAEAPYVLIAIALLLLFILKPLRALRPSLINTSVFFAACLAGVFHLPDALALVGGLEQEGGLVAAELQEGRDRRLAVVDERLAQRDERVHARELAHRAARLVHIERRATDAQRGDAGARPLVTLPARLGIRRRQDAVRVGRRPEEERARAKREGVETTGS